MARTRDVVLMMEICESKRADNTCAHDRKKHPVPRGETWLKVTDAGAMGRTRGYCVPCATKILEAAKAKVDGLLAEITAAAAQGDEEASR